MPNIPPPFTPLWICLGVILGALGMFYFIHQKQKKQASEVLLHAENEAQKIIERAETAANLIKAEIEEARNDLRERKNSIQENEKRLEEKEKKVDQKYDELEKKSENLLSQEKNFEKNRKHLEEKESSLQKKLEEIAKLSETDAKNELLKITEEKYESDILKLIEKKKKDAQNRSSEVAREIIIGAIQQYAGEVTNETTQTIFPLESDDLKGKLIGKEGRNITAFERATGVSLIIDDSPDTVFLSSFDLFRRYIAKKSLEDLIADKRIQPARIEEIVEKNQEDAEKLIHDIGQKTITEMGIIGVPEDLYALIGKFRFRASYGQNLLLHSKEVAYIAQSIAKMIGADADLALK